MSPRIYCGGSVSGTKLIKLGAYSGGYEFTTNLVHNGNIKHGDLHVADLTRNNIGFIWIYTPIVSNIEIHSIDRIYLCDGYILGLVFDVYMSIIIYFYCRFETLPYVCKYWLGNLHRLLFLRYISNYGVNKWIIIQATRKH